MRVTAAVMEEESGTFKLDTVDLDALRPDELLVKIVATGICHTDLHARDGYFPMLYPGVYGHEGAGVVAEIGGAVEGLAVGDHVVISFPWCGQCEHCRDDRRSNCRRGAELKSRGTRADGPTTMRRAGGPVHASFFQQSSFATYALALLGPFACGIQTGAGAVLNVMMPERGKSFAAFGAGSVGLAGLMAAKVAGCEPIIAVDIRGNRLALARALGATYTIDNASEDAVAAIRKITAGGAHFSLETSALPAVFREAVDCLLTRGTCVLVGSARRGTEVSFEMSTL
jgi:aryl-alcohol dehydrogenase